MPIAVRRAVPVRRDRARCSARSNTASCPIISPRSELPAGNALVEGATFIAILLGTIVGGLAAKDGGDPASFAVLMMVFALLCWGSSLFIPRTGEGAPDLVVSTQHRSPPPSAC